VHDVWTGVLLVHRRPDVPHEVVVIHRLSTCLCTACEDLDTPCDLGQRPVVPTIHRPYEDDGKIKMMNEPRTEPGGVSGDDAAF
jgi:hypothetical protein